MKTLRIEQFSGPQFVRVVDVESPVVREKCVKIAVHATGLNRADLIQTFGRYPPPKGYAPSEMGLEYAGVVSQCGSGARRFSVGERVMGLTPAGAFAEEIVVPEDEVIRVPKALSLTEAAAIVEAFTTAHDALVTQAGLKKGDFTLVHAAASGVGTAAIQICLALGATPIGTVRTPSKVPQLRALQLEHLLVVEDDSKPKFAEKIREMTHAAMANSTLDLVGGSYFRESIDSLSEHGTLVVLGLTAGITAEINLRTLLQKRLHIRGSTLRSRTAEEKAQLAQIFETALNPLFESRALKPVISSTVSYVDVHDAFQQMQNNSTVGKIVLSWRTQK